MEPDWDTLNEVSEGDRVEVTVVDFENANFPKDENPRTIRAEITDVAEDVSHSAGEVQRVVTVGDPYDSGFRIDLGDTRENNLTGGSPDGRPKSLYTKAWRPRPGKDRLLLGRVESVEGL